MLQSKISPLTSEVSAARLPREDAYTSWNRPASLSDFLYEYRHRLVRDKKISVTNEEDYQSLYTQFQLESVLPYDMFQSMALAKSKPSLSLLQHLFRHIEYHHRNDTLEVFSTAVKAHLPQAYRLNHHPYLLTGYLEQKIGSDVVTLYRMAQDLGIYPSMLKALMAGELVAPPVLRDHMCRYLGCSDEEKTLIQKSGADYLNALDAKKPRRSFLMRKLAEVDCHTPLVQVLENIVYEGSVVTREQFAQKTYEGITSLDTVMADVREKGRQLGRRNYNRRTVEKIADGLELTGNLRELLIEMGTRRAFGQLLEEYVLAGGRSWSGFIDSVMQDWSLGVVQLAGQLGMDVQIIIGWLGNDHDASGPSRPNRKSLEKLAENVKMTPIHKEWMMALALGDLSYGVDVKHMMEEAKSHMMTLATFHDREIYGARLLDQLLRRGGHSVYYLDDVEGFGPALMKRQCNLGLSGEESTPHPKWNKVVHGVAARICEAYPPQVAEEMAMVLQGVPGRKSPAQWLEEVKAGRITAGEMVRYHRLGQRLPMVEMMARLGKARNTEDYRVCEEAGSDSATCPSLGLTMALANDMRLNEQQTKDFTNFMRGDQSRSSQLLATLDKALKSEAGFKDVVYHILYDHYRAGASGGALGVSALAKDLGVAHTDVGHWLYGRRHIRQPELASKLAGLAQIPADRMDDFIKVAQGKIVQYDPSLMDKFSEAPDSKTRYELFHALRENVKLTIKECAERIGVDASSIRKSFLSNGCEWKVTRAPVEAMAEVLIPAEFPNHRIQFCEWFSAPPTQAQSHVSRLHAQRSLSGSSRQTG